mgnify:CR=1 FL=1
MSMHMEGPYLTTTGKKKGKQKFRNAAAANLARKNAEAWKELLEKYDVKADKVVLGKSKSVRKENSKTVASPRYDWRSRIDPRRLTDHIPSRDTGVSVAAKHENTQYTGDAMIGLGTLHKSNTVPVFSKQEAHDLAIMRRG